MSKTIDKKGNIGAHAFLLTGGTRRTSATYFALFTFTGRYTYGKCYDVGPRNQQYEGYAYLNWGWNGTHNGMYLYDNFVVNDEYASVYDTSATYISKK